MAYIIFYIDGEHIYFADIFAFSKAYFYSTLIKLLIISGRMKCHAIQIYVLDKNPYLKLLGTASFINARDDAVVMLCGNDELMFDKLIFFHGDRNL